MKVSANPAFARIRKGIAGHRELLRPWKGAAFRVTTLDYPSPQSILLGQGSFMYGGRWNAAGSFRAVYGSTSDLVAVAESRANAEYAGISYPFRKPRLLVMIELSMDEVLNLTAPDTLRALDLRSDELRLEDWRKLQANGLESLTQTIGRAVYENGGDGLLAPSAKITGGLNVVYLPENRRSANEATVCESEELDRISLKGR
jgi:RES domain-containing protein